ncbi:MAG: hypothetical protein QM737_09535 [Ferruginibacter sp.]
MNTKLFSLVIALLFCFISVSAQTSNQETVAVTGKQQTQTIKIKVAGINCSADCKDIQSTVAKMNGVTACSMKGKPGATTAFEVTFNPSLVSEKDIRTAVEGTPGCSNPDSRPYKVKG